VYVVAKENDSANVSVCADIPKHINATAGRRSLNIVVVAVAVAVAVAGVSVLVAEKSLK